MPKLSSPSDGIKLMTSTTATTTAAQDCPRDPVPLYDLGEPTGGFVAVSCCVPN